MLLNAGCIYQRIASGVLNLKQFGKEKMKISLMNNAIGSDIQGQKENVEMFCQIVSKLG